MAHLKGFGLENFRIFKEYTWFDFAPITILVGPNSSGKSSLIKALLLLKDNYEKKNLSNLNDVNYYAKYLQFDGLEHDLSGGASVLAHQNKSSTLSFIVPYCLAGFSKKTFFKLSYKVEANQTFVDSEEEIIDEYNNVLFSRKSDGTIFFDYPLFLKLIEPGLFIASDCKIDEIPEMLDIMHKTLWGDSLTSQLNVVNFVIIDGVQNLSGYYKKWHENVCELYQSIKYHNSEYKFFNKSINFKELFPEWPNTLVKDFYEGEGIEYETDRGMELYSSLHGLELILEQNSLTRDLSKNIHYLLGLTVSRKKVLLSGLNNLIFMPPVRGNVKRGFQSSEHNQLNNIFKTVSIYDEKRGLIRENEFLNKWGNKFGFRNLEICRNEELDINYLRLGGKLVSDVGYGLSQISVILLSVLLANRDKDIVTLDNLDRYKVLILEEPETSLHPKFQSILADLIAEERGNAQLIIETHSEYMIRKFQYLVAKGEMKPEDVAIYYFNDPNNVPAGEKQVKKINILEDGSLSDDFGPGFYDEAATWELELLKLKRNKNRQN